MNAVECIRWFGVDNAKYMIKEKLTCRDYDFTLDELKRLVESVELINCFDDLDQANSWVDDLDDDHPYVFRGDTYDNKFYRHQLKQAIADWESIYA